MNNEFRVQFENESGTALFNIFQTPSATRANGFLRGLTNLCDSYGLGHNIEIREYEYVGATGEWVEVQK